MLTIILIKKIISLFLIILCGFAIVKTGVLTTEQSQPISKVVLFIILPCAIVGSFQIEYTPEIRDGFMLALLAAVCIHIIFIIMNLIFVKLFHLNGVEQASTVYSNSANLIFPLVTALFGSEWIIYSSAFIAVQQVLMWSHGKSVLQEVKSIDIKKLLLNVNMICVFIGAITFVLHIQFPGPVQDTVDTFSSMAGPLAMLTIGMLIASMDMKAIISNKRLWFICLIRMLIMSTASFVFLKILLRFQTLDIARNVLLITLLAATAPAASSISQMAQVYEKDAKYASAISVLSTLMCIVTMPAFVALFLA